MPTYPSTTDYPVLDVTAKMRGHGHTTPVRVGHDQRTKDVVVVLDQEHAERLACLVALLDSNPDRARDTDALAGALLVTKNDQDVWMHACVDLLSAIRLASSEPLELIPSSLETSRLRSV